MVKVSCVIPAFNESSTIKNVLKVVKKVKTIDEIIVVDDGSTDGTRDIIEARKDERILYFRREKTPGERPSASRPINVGLRAVFNPYGCPGLTANQQGELEEVDAIAVLHDDDLVPGHSLGDRYYLLNNGQYGMVCGRERIIDKNDMIIKERQPPGTTKPRSARTRMLFNFDFPYTTVMVEKLVFERTGLFDESVGCGEDIDIVMRTLVVLDRMGLRLGCGDFIASYYRRHPDSVTDFYVERGWNVTDVQRVIAQNTTELECGLVALRKFARRPQSHLPEPIKRLLRPIRDVCRRPKKQVVEEPKPYKDQFLESLERMVPQPT